MNTKTILLTSALTLCALASSARADNSHGRYETDNIPMHASGVSFPSGNPYRTALGTVTSRYFSNPSKCWFTQYYDDSSIGLGNNESEVWFSSDPGVLGGAPAITYWWFNWLTGKVKEADVIFDVAEAYTTSMNKTSLWAYGGSYRPFETTCMHEYGHAAGLDHEADEYNIMGQDWTHIHCNGSTCRSYAGEDACDGLVKLYGTATGSFEDVSMSLFKYSGSSGGYSTHVQCVMRDYSSGAEISFTTFNGQKRYKVNKGQKVTVEFTYENDGKTTQSPNVGFYVSTNSTISTADTLVTTSTPTLGRNDVFTTTKTLTIPTTLTSGSTYYLGALVDYDAAISETDESNNAAYHILKIN